ncbi:hypothetical protein GALL_483630 [mine drainage metagenome]|uniref:EF-hand domain-containing protein n=1 Tax=mine drainage metagenome TaxID=410659 RepID=A0A1J5PF75_9ZZZZ
MRGYFCQPTDPIDHRSAGASQHMKPSAALRTTQQSTFNAQGIKLHRAIKTTFQEFDQSRRGFVE